MKKILVIGSELSVGVNNKVWNELAKFLGGDYFVMLSPTIKENILVYEV